MGVTYIPDPYGFQQIGQGLSQAVERGRQRASSDYEMAVRNFQMAWSLYQNDPNRQSLLAPAAEAVNKAGRAAFGNRWVSPFAPTPGMQPGASQAIVGPPTGGLGSNIQPPNMQTGPFTDKPPGPFMPIPQQTQGPAGGLAGGLASPARSLQAPGMQPPAVPGAPAPAPQTAPAGGQPYIPPPDPLAIPISGQSRDIQDAIRNTVGEREFSIIQNMPLSEALQFDPTIAWSFRGQRQGMSLTLSDLATRLGTKLKPGVDPNTPVDLMSVGAIDLKTGLPDLGKAASVYKESFDVAPTSFQAAGVRRQLSEFYYTKIAGDVRDIVTNARAIATGGGTAQQVHNQLQRAHDALAAFTKAHPDVDVSGIEIPNSQDLIGAGKRTEQTMAIALERLGITQQQLANALERLGITEARLQMAKDKADKELTTNDKAVLDLWLNPSKNVNWTDQQRAQLESAARAIIQKKLGLTLPPAPPSAPKRKGTPVDAALQGIIGWLANLHHEPQRTPAPSPTPSPSGISMPSVYRIWKQSGKPVPKDIWAQLSDADRQYLTEQHVTHE